MLRDLVGKVLRDVGYNVIFAEEGQEGLDKIVSEKPDLVLLDILMPRLNGFEVLEKIKEILGQ